MTDGDLDTYCPASPSGWRKWLEENHNSSESIWLVYYKISSPRHNLTWSEAVDEALCFGWIDSLKKTLDTEQYMQLFTRRKPRSTWSKINKEKVNQLILEGRMTQAGLQSVEVARQNGAWAMMDQVEDLIVPEDLEAALSKVAGAKAFYEGLSASKKKGILYWIVSAKRPETREKRIAEAAQATGKGQLPKALG